MREYIDYIHDKAKREDVHMGCYESPESDLFTGDFFDTAFSQFDRAEAAAAAIVAPRPARNRETTGQ